MQPKIGLAQKGVVPCPCMITAVNPDNTVELTLFMPGQMPEFQSNVSYSPVRSNDGWSPLGTGDSPADML